MSNLPSPAILLMLGSAIREMELAADRAYVRSRGLDPDSPEGQAELGRVAETKALVAPLVARLRRAGYGGCRPEMVQVPGGYVCRVSGSLGGLPPLQSRPMKTCQFALEDLVYLAEKSQPRKRG